MNKEELEARLRRTFIAELEDQVQVMNADLLALEANPTDTERLKSLFRVAHTLKGAARATGLAIVERVCHELETLLARARDGILTLGAAEFALLFSAADALADAGRRLKTEGDLADSTLDTLGRKPARPRRTARSPADVPSPSPPSPSPNPPSPGNRGDNLVRVEGEKLDALLAATGLLLVADSRVAGRPTELQALHEFTGQWATEWSRTGRQLRLALARSGAAPALMQAVNRTEENLRRVVHDAGRLAAAATEDARVLSQVADQVADRVRRLRMRPFGDACEALPRTVRDLASTGKELELEVAGGEVEVDRAVLDALREVLLHLVRNAVDHGIEPPAEREKAGKPRSGRVRVAAMLKGDRLSVTVADDGAGLDLKAIGDQLARRGLPIPGDEQELARTLFMSGMSTRSEVTAISGRGVGLDIVREAMERIRGSVSVKWVSGRGTTFTLECPPTLATTRALLVAAGSHLFAIPTTSIERLLRLGPEAIKHVEGRDVIVAGETTVPLVELARLLPPLVPRPVAGAVSVVLLREGEQQLAVAVEELLTEQEIVLRPLGRGRQPLQQIAAAAILGSGRVALVVDPVALIGAGLALGAGSGIALEPTRPEGPSRRRILVVDDSITTRTLEQSILEAAGYEVRTAVNGADGWKLLQEHGCDLVVSDIEMPQMDGFALCQAVRGSKRFKSLPVVLVTGLETPEGRARGLEVGADAYLGKSSFDQQNLLDTILQLLG